jgi:hypothetical protein
MAISIPPAKISIKPNPWAEEHASIILESGMMQIDYVQKKANRYSVANRLIGYSKNCDRLTGMKKFFFVASRGFPDTWHWYFFVPSNWGASYVRHTINSAFFPLLSYKVIKKYRD